MLYASRNDNKTLRIFRNIVLLVVAGASLGGCASGMMGQSSGSASLAPGASLPEISQPMPAPALTRQVAMNRPTKSVSIAMAPIVGPPSGVAKKLTSKISSELKKRNINVVKGKRGYNMRGYVVSSSEGNGAKLAYIWDLNNKNGRRQTRISGEKSVTGGRGGDPWKGVNDRVIASIASDTADQLAGWMVKKNGGSVVNTTEKITRSASSRKRRANRIPAGTRRAPSITASTSRSSRKRVIMAMVVPVTGAPGDGKSSLTKAIKKTLYAKGIRLTSKRTDSVYQVRGVVQVGKTKKGKQPIRIDWRVYDPKGKRLGTVTQKNEIPQGSLNGSWGPIADAAAGAAANGITKLLPKNIKRL